MKIFIFGVETNNKGAELMLNAILQEIERSFSDAIVYTPAICVKAVLQGTVKTSLVVKQWPFDGILKSLRRVFKRMHLSSKYLQNTYALHSIDYFLDASGFHFSDQKSNFNSATVWRWNKLLANYKKRGTKIVFLPQAFGPALKKTTLEGLKCISNYSDLIMPREQTSYNYLKSSGVVDMKKVHLFTDFTSLVIGTFPTVFEHLRNGICIIPNKRMIDTGVCSMDAYIGLISQIFEMSLDSGHPIYLLNHEGKGDEQLAYECKHRIGKHIEVVTGLNALEVKGMIASAYLVVSSRFHGVASALNSCVPCLATSWSHKYEELFKDYGLSDCVLPINDLEKVKEKVSLFLDDKENENIRQDLFPQVEAIKKQTKEMWNVVWSI